MMIMLRFDLDDSALCQDDNLASIVADTFVSQLTLNLLESTLN